MGLSCSLPVATLGTDAESNTAGSGPISSYVAGGAFNPIIDETTTIRKAFAESSFDTRRRRGYTSSTMAGFFRCRFSLILLVLLSVPVLSLPLTIGVPALGDGLAIGRTWDGICSYLRNEAEIEVTFRVYEDHASLLEALHQRFVDIAFIDAFWHYRENREHTGEERVSLLAVVEVAGRSGFSGRIIVPKNSIAYRIADLKGATLALTGPEETIAGYYLPLALLAEAGVRFSDLDDVLYVETYDSILKGVAYGEIDAGTLPSFFQTHTDNLIDSVRIIAESRPLPLPRLVFRSADEVQRYRSLQEVFLAMNSHRVGRKVLASAGFTGFLSGDSIPDYSQGFSTLSRYIEIFEKMNGPAD